MTWLTLSLMPIGDAMALIYTCPIFVMVLSFFLLRQKFGLFKVIITILSILGAVFIVNPSILLHSKRQWIEPSRQYYLGVLTSLIVAFFGGINTVVVYRLRNFHVHALLFTSGLLGLFLSLIMCPLDPLSQIFLMMLPMPIILSLSFPEAWELLDYYSVHSVHIYSRQIFGILGHYYGQSISAPAESGAVHRVRSSKN